MAHDVEEVQVRIASLVDQSISPPSDGGGEWNLRLKYIVRAIEEWGQSFDWEALRKEFWPEITGTSQGSISLPDDYRKEASRPIYYSGNVQNGEEWTFINSEDRKKYSINTKYCYTLGNRADGKTLVWNPATLASGASLLISYYSYPTSVASPADKIVVPDIEYVVNRSVAYIFESRSDARFQQSEFKARERLLNMIDTEQEQKYAGKGMAGSADVQADNRGFRLGRD